MVLITAPRVVATTWDSVGLHWGKVSQAYGDGELLSAAAGALGIFAIVLPVAGSGYR